MILSLFSPVLHHWRRASLLIFLLAILGQIRVHAGVIVTQNLGAGATSWPGTPLLSTVGNPASLLSVAEGFAAATTYAQTFTIPVSTNYTLESICLYAGGGTGTDGTVTLRINLYELGGRTAPNPDAYTGGTNLFGLGAGLPITYTTQANGLLRLDFTGPDQVMLISGRMYVFELMGVSGTNPVTWLRGTSDTYGGGAAYRDRSWINSTNARDFGLAVYGSINTNPVPPPSCTIIANATQQMIDGFGAGAAFLYEGQDPLNDTQMDALYGTGPDEMGLTLIRVRISPDYEWSAEISNGQKANARGAKVLASPWTPPAVMKSNGSLIHGSLLPSKYADYVAYLNSFTDAMAAAGGPVSVISLQNEPDFDPDYEGCTWTAEQFRVFCRDFAGGLNVPVMMPEAYAFNQAVSTATLNDPLAAANVDYVGGHLYGATIRDYPLARSLGKRLWMTEYLINDQTIASALETAQQIQDCLSIGHMSAYIWWKCIGDANGLLNNASVLQRRAYVMGQFSRFVRPGDYRVDVPSNNGPLAITAFKDAPSGRFTIIAVNTTAQPVTQTFNLQGTSFNCVIPWVTSATQSLEERPPVALTGYGFSYTVPAQAIVTFAGANPPAFTTQPVSQSVTGGSSVTFTAAATGLPTPTYQWQKNGADIPGATNATYTIASTAATDQASYAVVATNAVDSVTSNAVTLTLTMPAAFDVAGYFARNNDVAAAYGSDQLGAWLHFWNYGLAEGRQFDAQFIVEEYLLLNTDLTSAFGSDKQAALMHWLTYGKPVEDRIGRVPIGFNVDSYLARYPDLAAAFGAITPTAQRNVTVWNHYVDYGVREGRSDGDFEAYGYLAGNADLAAVFGSDVEAAAWHWYFYGRREGRRIPANFDVNGYRTRNPDVVVVWGNDKYGCWLHYRDTGVYENRVFDDLFRVLEYRARYSDVQATYGSNLTGVLNHWLFYGKPEGRLGRNP